MVPCGCFIDTDEHNGYRLNECKECRALKDIGREVMRRQKENAKLHDDGVFTSHEDGLLNSIVQAAKNPVIKHEENPHKNLRWRGDRTHEECCDCALLAVEPIQCEGHPAGECACKLFVEKKGK
jgi:hypothetical protein